MKSYLLQELFNQPRPYTVRNALLARSERTQHAPIRWRNAFMRASTTYAQNRRPFSDASENTSENHTHTAACSQVQNDTYMVVGTHVEHTSEGISIFGQELTLLFTLHP